MFELLEAAEAIHFPWHSNDTHDCVALRASRLIDGGPGFPTDNPVMLRLVQSVHSLSYQLDEVPSDLAEDLSQRLCTFLTDLDVRAPTPDPALPTLARLKRPRRWQNTARPVRMSIPLANSVVLTHRASAVTILYSAHVQCSR